MTQNIIETVTAAASRLAELGSWPAYINAVESLTTRVPQSEYQDAPGFDAGIACALDLIPRDKQRLAAILHAAYTPEAVEQVRREAKAMDPDSETCWWLAACAICDLHGDGGVVLSEFQEQLEKFQELVADPAERQLAAKLEFEKMSGLFQTVDGVAFGCVDGCMQGAYIAGHAWAVQYNPAYGIFFIGTFRESLGLEGFPFSDKKDGKGRPMSGPVHGSMQFVKASSFEELARIIESVEKYFDLLDSIC